MQKYLLRYSMGATAAIITSMGLIAGLAHSDSARSGIIAGLLIVAIADNISDTLGIHIYKESEGKGKKEIYRSTVGNFTVRFILALTFVAIVLLLPSQLALIISSLWGVTLLAVLSFLIAKEKKTKPYLEIFYHIAISILVIFGSKMLGNMINQGIIR